MHAGRRREGVSSFQPKHWKYKSMLLILLMIICMYYLLLFPHLIVIKSTYNMQVDVHWARTLQNGKQYPNSSKTLFPSVASANTSHSPECRNLPGSGTHWDSLTYSTEETVQGIGMCDMLQLCWYYFINGFSAMRYCTVAATLCSVVFHRFWYWHTLT